MLDPMPLTEFFSPSDLTFSIVLCVGYYDSEVEKHKEWFKGPMI